MDTGVTQAMIDGEEPLTPRHIYSCVPLHPTLRLHLFAMLCKRPRYWVCVQCDAGAEDDCGEAKERQVRRSQGSSGAPRILLSPRGAVPCLTDLGVDAAAGLEVGGGADLASTDPRTDASR